MVMANPGGRGFGVKNPSMVIFVNLVGFLKKNPLKSSDHTRKFEKHRGILDLTVPFLIDTYEPPYFQKQFKIFKTTNFQIFFFLK